MSTLHFAGLAIAVFVVPIETLGHFKAEGALGIPGIVQRYDASVPFRAATWKPWKGVVVAPRPEPQMISDRFHVNEIIRGNLDGIGECLLRPNPANFGICSGADTIGESETIRRVTGIGEIGIEPRPNRSLQAFLCAVVATALLGAGWLLAFVTHEDQIGLTDRQEDCSERDKRRNPNA